MMYSLTIYGEAQPNAVNVSKGVEVVCDVVSDDLSDIDLSVVHVSVTKSGTPISDLSVSSGIGSAYIVLTPFPGGLRIAINSTAKYIFKSGSLIEVFITVLDEVMNFSFTIEKFTGMPTGKYSLEYDSPFDMLVRSGQSLRVGSSYRAMIYDQIAHLGAASSRYNSGYFYGASYPALAALMDFRMMNVAVNNAAKYTQLGISPERSALRVSQFESTPAKDTMLIHYDRCIDNLARYYATNAEYFLVDGQFNDAAAFSGDPLIVSNLNYVSLDAGTIQMWVKRLCLAPGSRYYIIDTQAYRARSDIQPGFALYVDNNGDLVFEIVGYAVVDGTTYLRRDSYAVRTPISAADLNGDNFTHLAITWNNSTNPDDNFMQLFVNGVKKSILKWNGGAKFAAAGTSYEEEVFQDYADATVTLAASSVDDGDYLLKAAVFKFISQVVSRTIDPTSFDENGVPLIVPPLYFANDIGGLYNFYLNFVYNRQHSMSYATYTGSFADWIDALNDELKFKYNQEVASAQLLPLNDGVRKQIIDYVSDFSYIYIGTDNQNQNPGQIALDQIAFYSTVLADEQIQSYKSGAPIPIDITDVNVSLGYDFNYISNAMTFANVQDERGKYFEASINVLNPFSFPIDRGLIASLINMIRPAPNYVYHINFPG